MMKTRLQSLLRQPVSPASLITAAGMVLCIATTLGFLGRFSWKLDLFSHFRVQYFFGLIAAGTLLLVSRRPRHAFTMLVFAGVNFALILPLYVGKPTPPKVVHTPWRAMLINVNTERGDPILVRGVIEQWNPDILVLEEINARWLSDLVWLTNSHPYSLTEPREDNFGIGVFSKYPLIDGDVTYIGNAFVPSILVTVDAGHTHLRLLATHPPPPSGRLYSEWRNDQLEKLPDYVRSPLPVLLLGDLNTTPWNYYFRRLLTRSGLRDSAKGFGLQPSWPNFNPLLRIPIDHCLHSTNMIILNRYIGEDVSSDHFPLIVDFVIARE